MANTTTQQPKSNEEQALEKQLAVEKLKKDIADNQRGQMKAPEVTALQGNITSDGSFIESRILAGKTLALAFERLGEKLARANLTATIGEPAQLILISAADIALVESYAGMEAQLVLLQNQYDSLNKTIRGILNIDLDFTSFQFDSEYGLELASGPDKAKADKGKGKSLISPLTALPALAALSSGPLAVGFAGAAILRTAIDMASLFRVDTDYKNFDVPVDELTLLAGLRRVIPSNWTIRNPLFFPINMIRKDGETKKGFLDIMADIQIKSGEALTLLANINDQIKDLTAVEATEKPPKLAEIKSRLETLSACQTAITNLNTSANAVQTAMAAVDPTTKTSPLMNILKAERLIRVMQTGNVFIVKIAAISKGSNKVSRSRWWGAKIEHSAGTELSCVIAKSDGEIVFSDTQLTYTPYMKAADVRAETTSVITEGK